MNNKVMFSSAKDDWETPQALFDELDREFHFTLDAAASPTKQNAPNTTPKKITALRRTGAVKRYSAIHHTAARQQANGRASATKKHRSREQWSC